MTAALIVAAILVFLLPLTGWILKRWHIRPLVGPDDMLEMPVLPVVRSMMRREDRIVASMDFLPLVEILSGTDLDLKRSAIEQLARFKTPEAIRALIAERRSPSVEIRYYVNAALSRIKREFDEALGAARHQMQTDIYKVSARTFLAKVYLQYVHSGLLDSGLATSYEQEAIFHLTFAIESPHPTGEAYRMLLECMMERQEWAQAQEVLQRGSEAGFFSADEMCRSQAIVSYHMRQFSQIPLQLQKLASHETLDAEWKTAVLWWGGTAS